MFGGISQPQEMDFSKKLAVEKYNKKKMADNKEKAKQGRRRKIKFQSGEEEEVSLEVQAGSISNACELLSDIDRLRSVCGDMLNMNRVEDFILYIIALCDANSWKGMVASTIQYYKTFNNRSLVNRAICAVKNISKDFEHELSLQSGDEEEPIWLQLLKQGKEGWKILVNNPAFKHLSKLLSISSALGLCDLSRFNVDMNGLRVFSLEAYHKHVKATDLIDALISTMTFFIEGGYWLFKKGNLNHFMYNDQQINDLEAEYFEVKGLINHVKTGNLEKFAGMSENDFAYKLESVISKLTYFNRNVPASMEKRIIQSYIIDLKRMEAQFQAERTTGKLRAAPFAVYVSGTSGVGKSHVAKLLMMQILKAGNHDSSDDRIVVLNADDKFMSNYRTHVNGVYIDDLGNTIAQYCQASPTQKIIDIVNNIPSYAVMPEAELKGKVSIEPKAVVVTSNVGLDKHAKIFSNEPFSIVRRCPIHVNVTVKPEFSTLDARLDPKKMRDEDFCPDAWDLHVGFPDQHRSTYVDWQPNPMNLKSLLKLVTEKTMEHEAAQKSFLLNCSSLNDKISYCQECKQPTRFCYCCEPHDGDETDPDDQFNKDKDFYKSHMNDFEYAWWEDDDNDYIDIIDTDKSLNERFKEYMQLRFPKLKVPVLEWVDMRVYESLRNSCVYSAMYVYMSCMNELVKWRDKALTQICFTRQQFHATYMFLVGTQFILKMMYPSISWGNFCLMLPFVVLHRSISQLETVLSCYSRYRRVRGHLSNCMKKARSLDRNTVLGSMIVIVALYSVFRVIRTYMNTKVKKTKAKKQGNLIPKDAQDVDQRDLEENVWLKAHVTTMPATDASKSSTPDAVINAVSKNIAYMRILDEEGHVRFSNILFLKSNLALIPNHMWANRENMKIQVIKDNADKISSTFITIISRLHSVHIPDTDLSLIYVASGGSWRNLIKFFPLAHLRRCPATMVYKLKSGELTQFRAMIEPRLRVSVEDMIYSGFDYRLDSNTFKGLCLGTWITQTPAPVIAGFHLAGKTGENYGVAGTITQQQLSDGIDILSKIPGVLLAKDSGTLPKVQYGIDYYEGEDIHYKSPVNYLEAPAQIDMYGSVRGRSTYYSEVVKTTISDTVQSVTGVPNKWGKPKFKPAWKPFQANLAVISNPALPFEGNILSKAVSCYLSGIKHHLSEHEFYFKDIKPLTRMQNVCGIDGKRFIDALVPSTSLGFPLTGPKSSQLVFLDPEDYPDFACPKELNEMFWTEVERMEETYVNGERCYPIFKGCLKDEPTALIKDKVRVFQAAPIALQLLIRQYFLPIVRYLQLNPTISELAVGVNAHGPEWDQLARHIMKNGKERILAGDYSKYDTRMPAQVTLAAFDVLISLAKHTGNYSERDISVMQGIATDCCYPTVAMNGDLLQFYGSNPSGNNITVIINCIVNSLNLRCAYYALRPIDVDLDFREAVSLITYGDDFKSSVVPECPWYNHITVAEYLSRYDQRLTMPDKKSTPTEYMHDDDVDFLKRRNKYNPIIDKYMAVLDEDSIFKSLHSILKSKSLSNLEVCACNIDGALREWFFYGPETYELRRMQMKEIASTHKITHMCQELNVVYDDRFKAYCEQYDLTPRR